MCFCDRSQKGLEQDSSRVSSSPSSSWSSSSPAGSCDKSAGTASGSLMRSAAGAAIDHTVAPLPVSVWRIPTHTGRSLEHLVKLQLQPQEAMHDSVCEWMCFCRAPNTREQSSLHRGGIHLARDRCDNKPTCHTPHWIHARAHG